ncbi:hypothetical protein [Microbulbifer sp. SAOS-129_SWC]|uniref:hypothetical protein n=1 Tax=Microbulbifer sp. SAOS-129_SWC TaxID=3145235 RepID=UPI003217C4A9
MNNQRQVWPVKAVIVCSPERLHAHRWSMQLAEALGGEFAELKSAHDPAAVIGLAANRTETPRILFARAPELIDPKLVEDAVILILVDSPSEYVARELEQGATVTAEKCDVWMKDTQNQLNFFQRNRGASTLLVTQNDIRTRPEDCLAALESKGLNLAKLPDFPHGSADPMLVLLANLLAERHTRSRNLYLEVLVASSLIRQDEELGTDFEPDMGAVSAYLHAQLEIHKKVEQLKLTASSEEARSELESAHLEIHQLQEKLESVHGDSTEKSREQVELQQEKLGLRVILEERESELELAHLEIHQLQEKLESVHVDSTEKTKERAELHQKTLGPQGVIPEEWESELELAHLQIHQLQEKLEEQYLNSANNDEADKKSNVGQQDSGEQDLKLELELALLQIHQLQEELEIYYQKYLQECKKPVDLFEKIGGVVGSDTLRVLRLARSPQHIGLRG